MTGSCRFDRLRHPNSPCEECPWRLDQPVGRFTPERYEVLRDTCRDPDGGNAGFGAPLFACHKTPDGRETACAGWLAVEGWNNVPVRMAVLDGRLDPAALVPDDDWPPLYPSYEALADANSGEGDGPTLACFRGEHSDDCDSRCGCECHLDAARMSGPHTLDCPAWGEDPAGIEQCQCQPTDREATRP